MIIDKTLMKTDRSTPKRFYLDYNEEYKKIKRETQNCTIKWVAIILLVIIVCILISIFLSHTIINGDNLLNGIVNFATIVSIILSITSIFYTAFTSRDTSAQFSNIDKAVAIIKENNDKIESNNRTMLQTVFELTKDIAIIKDRTGVQSSNKASSPKGIDKVPDNLPKSSDLLKEYRQ